MLDGWCQMAWTAFEISPVETAFEDPCDIISVGMTLGLDCRPHPNPYMQMLVDDCMYYGLL